MTKETETKRGRKKKKWKKRRRRKEELMMQSPYFRQVDSRKMMRQEQGR